MLRIYQHQLEELVQVETIINEYINTEGIERKYPGWMVRGFSYLPPNDLNVYLVKVA